MDSHEFSELTAFAIDIAQQAGQIALRYFRQPLDVVNKADSGFDPVTRADREIETLLGEAIGQRYPSHTIVGEEHGKRAGDEALAWIIDPIDGTRAFISGMPLWGIMLGFAAGEQIRLGVVHQPYLGETFVGNGSEAWLYRQGVRQPLRTARTSTLAAAVLYATTPDMFAADGEQQAFDALAGQCRLRRFGGDCYAYLMLAAGHVDLVAEASLAPYDIIPLIPIIEGAGGVVSDWNGGTATRGGRVIAAANATLHARGLAMLCQD